MSQPLVTVIMAAYNGERYIRQALDSALAQTYPCIEVVVVNDGANDSTPQILAEYGDRIRWYTQPNAGQAAARNLGIARSKGQWVGFLDQDDLWEPLKLEVQMKAMRDKDAVIHSSVRIVDANGHDIAPPWCPPDRVSDIGLLEMICGMQFAINSALVRRDALETVGGFDPLNRFGTTDYQLGLRLAASGYHFHYINAVLASHRIHGANMSLSGMRMAEGAIYALIRTRKEYANAFGCAERRAFRRRMSQRLFDLGWNQYDRRDYASAFKTFWRAIRHDPLRPHLWAYALATGLPFRRWILPRLRAIAANHQKRPGAGRKPQGQNLNIHDNNMP